MLIRPAGRGGACVSGGMGRNLALPLGRAFAKVTPRGCALSSMVAKGAWLAAPREKGS